MDQVEQLELYNEEKLVHDMFRIMFSSHLLEECEVSGRHLIGVFEQVLSTLNLGKNKQSSQQVVIFTALVSIKCLISNILDDFNNRHSLRARPRK